MRRWRPRDIVDAIEANALHGGRMSLSDSVRLTVLTIFSAGVGASVGMEAAFTQLGSGTASRLGRLFRLRCNDLRTFVGCGAAAAIAAAFNAPLAGAFYAFELIIGSYTLATLIPVVTAAVMATLVTRELFGEQPIFIVFAHTDIVLRHYLILAAMGYPGRRTCDRRDARGHLCRAIRAPASRYRCGRDRRSAGSCSAFSRWGFRRISAADMAASCTRSQRVRPAIAAAPDRADPGQAAGSAVSIGSGFRRGMFSSSLYSGACSARLARWSCIGSFRGRRRTMRSSCLAGMGAVAAGIVGAPMTMIFLVLEATADFSATMGVTVAVVIAALIVRHFFGYSFATWRFHLRGVPLHSPHDIGWLQDLQVAKLMRRDFAVVPPNMPLAELCRQFPITESRRLFVVNESGAYAGYIDLIEVHSTGAADDGER